MTGGRLRCDGRPLPLEAWRAQRLLERMRGLLGRPQGSLGALWIAPCNSIHTFAMGYAIDVAFLDAQGRVLATHAAVRPARMRWCWPARSVLELPAGGMALHGIVRGAELTFEAHA
ncbi:DUF192 domain-containing protein [Xylophilus sp. GW821-FHT01B05]